MARKSKYIISDLCEQIMQLKKENLSNRKIAKRIGISEGYVRKLLRKNTFANELEEMQEQQLEKSFDNEQEQVKSSEQSEQVNETKGVGGEIPPTEEKAKSRPTNEQIEKAVMQAFLHGHTEQEIYEHYKEYHISIEDIKVPILKYKYNQMTEQD